MRERAPEHFIAIDQAILHIQKQHDERFMRAQREVAAQIVPHSFGRTQRLAPELLGHRAPRQFERRLQLRILGRPEPVQLPELAGIGMQQPLQRAEVGEGVARQRHGAFPGHAHAQEDRQQFGVGQCRRAIAQQALAGAVLLGPVTNSHRDSSPKKEAARAQAARVAYNSGLPHRGCPHSYETSQRTWPTLLLSSMNPRT